MPLLLVGGCTGAEGTWCDGYGLWTGSSSGGSTDQKFRLVSSVFSAESRVDIHATSVRCVSVASAATSFYRFLGRGYWQDLLWMQFCYKGHMRTLLCPMKFNYAACS